MPHDGESQPMTARRGTSLRGQAAVPGDKSVSHRALILGAGSGQRELPPDYQPRTG